MKTIIFSFVILLIASQSYSSTCSSFFTSNSRAVETPEAEYRIREEYEDFMSTIWRRRIIDKRISYQEALKRTADYIAAKIRHDGFVLEVFTLDPTSRYSTTFVDRSTSYALTKQINSRYKMKISLFYLYLSDIGNSQRIMGDIMRVLKENYDLKLIKSELDKGRRYTGPEIEPDMTVTYYTLGAQ